MKKPNYIPPIPGQIKDGDDTRTNLLALLGLEALTPLDIGSYNDGRFDPPVATVCIDGKEYSLKSILSAIAKPVQYSAQSLTAAQRAQAIANLGAARNGGVFDYSGVNLKTVFGTATAFATALRAEDFSKIRIGDYWPVTISGTYRDVGSYTCPAGTTLYSDTGLTTEAGTAATALEAQWISDVYCKVSSGGEKYCATSDCLAYYVRTLSNAALKLEVAGINPYWRYGDSGEIADGKPHIYFLTRDLLPHYLRMRKANTAWHVDPNPSGGIGPWQGSALYATFNDPDYGILKLIAATDIGAYIYGGADGKGRLEFY